MDIKVKVWIGLGVVLTIIGLLLGYILYTIEQGVGRTYFQCKSLGISRESCGSAGHVSQDAVKRYIDEQMGKDVFEYSIFGDSSGQTKIGNFSLDRWT